ncbi:MAG: hypothetical protein ACR5K7_00605 [Symbiopectobacterium sp.]
MNIGTHDIEQQHMRLIIDAALVDGLSSTEIHTPLLAMQSAS